MTCPRSFYFVNPLIILVTFLGISTSHWASARDGGHVGGGSSCKNEIDRNRIQIRNWIARGEAQEIDFSKAEVPGWTYDGRAPTKSYKNAMLGVLTKGKVIVNCYLDPALRKDPVVQKIAKKESLTYRSITIGTPPEPTECINYEDNLGRPHIDCNYDAIMNKVSRGDPDYALTHHEFASIAGVERRTDNYVSDYSISRQLAQFEHWRAEKVLGTKVTAANSCAECADLSPKELLSKIDGVYSHASAAKVNELLSYRVGVATCTDGEYSFYVPFAFGGRLDASGPVATFARVLGSVDPYVERDVDSTYAAGEERLNANRNRLLGEVHGGSSMNSRFKQNADDLWFLLNGDIPESVRLRRVTDSGVYVFRWHFESAMTFSCLL